MWKMRHHINSNKRRASHDYIETKKEFWSLPKNQPITINKIKRYVNIWKKRLRKSFKYEDKKYTKRRIMDELNSS